MSGAQTYRVKSCGSRRVRFGETPEPAREARGLPLQHGDVATSCRVIGGLQVGLVIPDLWQQEAIRALQQGKDVVVQAPTGSGKTYIFELFYPDLKEQAVFTVPTRALANDKLAEWRTRASASLLRLTRLR